MKLLQIVSWIVAVYVLAACDSGSEPTPQPKHAEPKTVKVGKGPDALFLTPDERYLYAANVEDSYVSVIDTQSDEVVMTIDTVDYPWGFARLGATTLVAVSGWNKGIDVVDFTSHEIVRTRNYDHNLGGIVSNDAGDRLWVVATEENKVLEIDVNSLEIVDEYVTGDGPDGIGMSKDGRKIYVTNTKEGTISVIILETRASTLITTGGKPELVHANEDKSLLYISNFLANKIHILDTETDAIVKEITGLDGPEEAVLSQSGDVLFVVNFNSSIVFTYDAKTYEKLAREFTVGTKPIGVVSAANDGKLYVTNYGDNSVTVTQLTGR